MALWEKSLRLTGPLLEQMKALYGPKLPIEVRHYLSNWIEAQSWGEVDPDDLEHNNEATQLFEGMLQALQDLMTTYSTNFITRTQLEALYTHMRNEYVEQPLELVRVVQNCLYREADLVEKQEQLSAPSPLAQQSPSANARIQPLIQGAFNRTEAMEAVFRQLSSKLENFILQYQESFQIDTALRQGNRIPIDQVGKFRERKQLLDKILAKDTEEMRNTCTDMGKLFLDCLEQVHLVQNLVVSQELANWKQSQRMFNWEDDRGKVELNNIQQWFEALAELLWRNRLLSKRLDLLKTRIPQHILQADPFASVAQRITMQLVELIQASLVLEKQPPQIIRPNKRFSATVRLLVGGKFQIHLAIPEVVVTIINDKQAKVVAADPEKQIPPNFASGDVLNNKKAMEYNSQTGMLSCAFNFMQLKRIKRNYDKKASEVVVEEKFTLLFRTHFTIGGGELEVNVKTESLPVVVNDRVTQQPLAEATIFWDNVFAEANREPFVVPENVPWPRLSDALNCFFHANCGRGLTALNLDYLGRKLLGIGPEEDLNQMSVSRAQLCKDRLKTRNFTFWEWFYKHLDLLKATLKREWMEGSIQGFMQKSDAEKLLLGCGPGTFLIRFSEEVPGGISVTWVTEDVTSTERQVLSLAPWNKHDLGIRPFADRLHDLGHLVILYPTKQKDDVFGKYYAPPSAGTNKDGDIEAPLMVTLPGVAGAHFGSSPTSPAPSIFSMTAATPLSPPQWPEPLSSPQWPSPQSPPQWLLVAEQEQAISSLQKKTGRFENQLRDSEERREAPSSLAQQPPSANAQIQPLTQGVINRSEATSMELPTLDGVVKNVGIPPTLLDQSCSDEHLTSISLFLDWRRVAPHLGLKKPDIDDIEAAEKTDSVKRLVTLQRWKMKYGYLATYKALVQVLLNVGCADHAGRVCQLLQPQEHTEPAATERKRSATSEPSAVKRSRQDESSPGSETAAASVSPTVQPTASLLVATKHKYSNATAYGDQPKVKTEPSEVKISMEMEIQELEDQFFTVVCQASSDLENVDLSIVKLCIANLPVSLKHQHIKFLDECLPAIECAESVSEIFSILSRNWDFMNCGLLKEMVRKLGSNETKQLMEEYSEKLREFRMKTKFIDFTDKWTGNCPSPILDFATLEDRETLLIQQAKARFVKECTLPLPSYKDFESDTWALPQTELEPHKFDTGVEFTTLPGTDAVGETQLIITNQKSYFEWKGYGLKLHIPENALPQNVNKCTLTIRALLLGQFELPPESILASAVYQIEAPVKLARQIILEIQHCSSDENSTSLCFVVAQTNSKLPYRFIKLEGGTFFSQYSYGSISLDHFCLFAIASWVYRLFFPRPVPLLHYCAQLYRICQQNPANWGLHFVITKDLDTEITAIRKKLEGKYSEVKVDVQFPVQFEDDVITLSIPTEGVKIRGWKISCLHDPSITKAEVDSFRHLLTGSALGCLLHIHWMDTEQPTYFDYKVTLNGAKPSRNYFTVIYPPLEAAAIPESHSATSTDSEMVPLDSGKETTQYKKVAAKYDLIITTLSKTVSAETLADKLHVKRLIGDDIRSKAQVAGVGEDKIRPVIDAVLSKIELNSANYDEFIGTLREFGDLEDLIECI